MSVNFLYQHLQPGLSGNIQVMECGKCHAVILSGSEGQHGEWHEMLDKLVGKGVHAYYSLRPIGSTSQD